MDTPKLHLFICTNKPDSKGKCGSKNSERLRHEVKELCRDKFGKEIRVNSAGCLGLCELGINAVLYPEGRWFHNLTDQDGKSLFKAVKESFNK